MPIVAPRMSPRQLLWPPFGFGKRVSNAHETDVELLSDWLAFSEWAFAGLVVLGVAGEFVIAFRHPPYDSWLGQWGPAYGDLLVAIGVAGEVIASVFAHACQGELTRRSKDRLSQVEFDNGFLQESAAKANERAVALENASIQLRLDLENERQKNAYRVVPREVLTKLKSLKGLIPKIILTKGESDESSWFSRDLLFAFIEAGIGVEEHDGTNAARGTGLMLYLPEGLADFEEKPLYKALAPLGPISGSSQPLASGVDTSVPMLIVGEKSPNFVTKPGWLQRGE